jgi:uncharacterized damage-inducible protein DinB
MNKKDIHVFFEYNRWANARILGAAAEISEAQFLAPTTFPHGGLRGTLVHTLFAEWIWRMGWQGAAPYVRLKPEDFPTIIPLQELGEAAFHLPIKRLAALGSAWQTNCRHSIEDHQISFRKVINIVYDLVPTRFTISPMTLKPTRS